MKIEPWYNHLHTVEYEFCFADVFHLRIPRLMPPELQFQTHATGYFSPSQIRPESLMTSAHRQTGVAAPIMISRKIKQGAMRFGVLPLSAAQLLLTRSGRWYVVSSILTLTATSRRQLAARAAETSNCACAQISSSGP